MPGASIPSRSPNTSAGWSCASTSQRPGRRDQAAHAWPDDAPLISVVRGTTAVIVGYGSIGREVARQLSSLGMRIIAVKSRPSDRRDIAFRVPGTGDPDGSIPERIVGDEALAGRGP